MAAYQDYFNWRKDVESPFPESVWMLLESVRTNFLNGKLSNLGTNAREEAIDRTLLFFDRKFLLPSTLDYLDTKATGEDSFRNTIYFLLSQFYNDLGMQRNPKYAAFSDLLKYVLKLNPEIFSLSSTKYVGNSSVSLASGITENKRAAEDLLPQNPVFKQKAKNERAKQIALRAIQILSEENSLLFNQLLPRLAAAFGVSADVFTTDLNEGEGPQDQDEFIPNRKTLMEFADSSTDPSCADERLEENSLPSYLLSVLEKQAGVKKVKIYIEYLVLTLAAEEKNDANSLEKSTSSSSDNTEPIIQVLRDGFKVGKSTIYAAIKDCNKILQYLFAKHDVETYDKARFIKFAAQQKPAAK